MGLWLGSDSAAQPPLQGLAVVVALIGVELPEVPPQGFGRYLRPQVVVVVQ